MTAALVALLFYALVVAPLGSVLVVCVLPSWFVVVMTRRLLRLGAAVTRMWRRVWS